MASAKGNRELTNVDLVVYALGLLDGARHPIHSEEIAAKAFELAPDRFCWRLPKYRHYPDKYIAKTALEDAKKRALGHLVAGSYAVDPRKDGWRLTTEGARWLQANAQWLQDELRDHETSEQAPRHILPKQDLERFRRQIYPHPLFSSFRGTAHVSEEDWYQLADLLHIRPDASQEVVRTRFDKLRSLAELTSDADVIQFLEACARTFPQLTEVSPNPSPIREESS
ncbi:hypothetical protein [Corallococcus sp. M7]